MNKTLISPLLIAALFMASISNTQAARLRMMEMEAQALSLAPSKAELEADYRLWLCNLLPAHFRSSPDVQFSPHQQEFWNEWAWQENPDPGAGLLIWNRGGNKSTSAQAFAVARGARGRSKYVLIVCRTQPQADSHIQSINSMLLSSNVPGYYPAMSQPNITHVGNRSQKSAWNHEMLTTAEGWTARGFGLLSAGRGVKVEQYRPDLIIISDIDKVLDSPGMVKSLLSALSADVLGTMANDCMVLFDQNLIHRGSVLNKVLTRETDVLSERRVFGPVPALRGNPKYKRVHERWSITQGDATWPAGMPVSECERKLNHWGMETWEREAQHNINLAYPDAIYPMWNEVYHLITWDEFAAFFFGHDKYKQWVLYDDSGNPRLPKKGNVAMCQDWGNRDSHPCANRWTWWPGEGMPLTDSIFHYREMCWPRFPKVEDDDREGPSPLQVAKAIHAAEAVWKETDSKRLQFRLASHERPEIVKAYKRDLSEAGVKPLHFQQIDTAQAREGILHVQNFLTIIKDELHPFAIDPRTADPARAEHVPRHKCMLCNRAHAGNHLVGRPRMYFVVGRGQGELYEDEKGELARRPAIDEAGMARTRFEYPNYRKPDTAAGGEKKDPPKIGDDIIDDDRAILGRIGTTLEPLTDAQRVWLRVQTAFPDDQRPTESPIAWDQSKRYYEGQWAKELNKPNMYGDGIEFYEEERIRKEQNT